MLIKYAQSEGVVPLNNTAIESNASLDSDIDEYFKKFAKELRKIAPRAKDFLYFTAVMMHAAEASIVDKQLNGEPVTASWEKVADRYGTESVRWVCSDPNIKPYKNSNGDIFPEYELITAHKRWKGRPLCIDHKSSSVDHIRGLIVDTYYDKERKRVIALCALDKKTYPDLAHKVSTGTSVNVSMGTAVGRAICTEEGCHRVARVESDFCEHMRAKSGYGEINEALAPIELSIVVNGADPDAKIKYVIAKDLSKAADHIQSYIDGKISTGDVNVVELSQLQKDLEGITERVNKLVASVGDSNELTEGAPYGMSSGSPAMPGAEVDNSPTPHNLPEPFPTIQGQVEQLQMKLARLQKDFEKLSSINNNEETTMTTKKNAYFQGGGGVNEPTPGTPKYPVEDYVTVRDTQDKQMTGQPPFPEVGPIDGMHPGPQSAGISEEARKKELQRLASTEERRLRREATLNKIMDDLAEGKTAYYHGGGGVNEPTPGKTKYPPDPMQEKVRNTQDKQMVGQKPFPGVGPVDGMHPGPQSADVKDELKRKQMLLRANLKARFVRTANPDGSPNLKEDAWEIYAGDNKILTATVDEITRGNAEVMHESVATKEFGKGMIAKIRAEGFDKAKALYKGGQAAPEPMKAAPGSPPDAAGPAAMPEMPDMPEDPGMAGGAEESVGELAEKIIDYASDIKERASEMAGGVDAAESEMEGLGDVPAADEGAFVDDGQEVTTASMQSMRKTLNKMLTQAMKESVEGLLVHANELEIAGDIYKNKLSTLSAAQRKYLDSITASSYKNARNAMADSERLMSAFLKYANGTQNLLKRAAAEAAIKKQAEDDALEGKDVDVSKDENKANDTSVEDANKVEDTNNADPARPETEGAERGFLGHQYYEPGPGMSPLDEVHLPAENVPAMPPATQPGGAAKPMPVDPSREYDPMYGGLPGYSPEEQAAQHAGVGLADDGVTVQIDPENPPMGTKLELTQANEKIDLTTKEGRAMARTKLAQKGLSYSDMLNRAHPSGSEAVANLDTKPSGDLGTVEDLESVHSKMMDVATMPPKVRKQAAEIAKLVAQGELAPEEVDGLVALGVDADAVKYYKKFWSEAKDKDSSQFAAELVKEHASKKQAEELQATEVRIKRAYDLAYEMRDRGVIESNQIKQQVEEIMGWNEASFDSFKKIVAQHPLKKQAMPNVGLLHSEDVILPASQAVQTEEQVNMTALFEGYFANKKL